MSTQQKFKLSEIAKYPAAYVIFIMAGLIGYFSRSWGESAGGRAEDSKYREEQCQIDLRSERREKDVLVKQLLIKTGTIDAVNTLADSVRINPTKPTK